MKVRDTLTEERKSSHPCTTPENSTDLTRCFKRGFARGNGRKKREERGPGVLTVVLLQLLSADPFPVMEQCDLSVTSLDHANAMRRDALSIRGSST